MNTRRFAIGLDAKRAGSRQGFPAASKGHSTPSSILANIVYGFLKFGTQILVLGLLSATAGYATDYPFNCTADATIVDKQPGTNFGGTPNIWAGFDTSPANAGNGRTLLQFNLTVNPVPAWEIDYVTDVFLKLNTTQSSTSNAFNVWTNGSSWGEYSVNWNNQPSVVSNIENTLSWSSTDYYTVWLSRNGSAWMRNWLKGITPNYGFAIRNGWESNSNHPAAAWTSINNSNPSKPVLIVRTSTPPTPSITITNPVGSPSWQRGICHLITWTPQNVSWGDKIQVVYSPNNLGSEFFSCVELPASATSCNWCIPPDAPLTNQYRVIVRMIYHSGIYAADTSDLFSVIPTPCPVAPNQDPPQAGCSSIKLFWDDVSNEEGYQIIKNNGPLAPTLVANTTTFEDHDVVPQIVYNYKVKAFKTGCADVFSNQVSAQLQVLPEPPTGVVATGYATKITIGWNAVLGATSYTVYRDDNITLIPSPPTNLGVDDNNPGSVSRCYRVTAQTPCGETEMSAQRCAIVSGSGDEGPNLLQLIVSHVRSLLPLPDVIADGYAKGDKWVAWASAELLPGEVPAPVKTFTLAIDLADYVGVTAEGREGWVTLWADASTDLSWSPENWPSIPIGAEKREFQPSQPDKFQNPLVCSAGLNAYGFGCTAFEINVLAGGIIGPKCEWSGPRGDVSVGVGCDLNGFISIEMRKEVLAGC